METEQTKDWSREKRSLEGYVDPVEVRINMNNLNLVETDKDKMTAIRLDNSLNITEVDGYYDEESNQFVFATQEPGTFTVIKKTDELASAPPVIDAGEENNHVVLIIIGAGLGAAAFFFLNAKSKSKKQAKPKKKKEK